MTTTTKKPPEDGAATPSEQADGAAGAGGVAATPTTEGDASDGRVAFHLVYDAASAVETLDNPQSDAGPAKAPNARSQATVVRLATDRQRAQGVRLEARVVDPLAFREGLCALHSIVASDMRYVPRDRTAYMAYLRMRRQAAGQAAWAAQQAYFAWLLANDPGAFVLLDPLVSVYDDQVAFEVFSKDQGSYGRLAVDRAGLELLGDRPVPGTTNIDFSTALVEGLQQMRRNRVTTLRVGGRAVALTTALGGGATSQVIEKRIAVPESWLRGFLQVQSAAVVACDGFEMSGMALYNVLRTLSLRADRKGQGRALRVELVPGEVPRLVLEPWETVISAGAEVYRGRAGRVVRLWGRRRLLLARRLAPFVDRVSVRLLGSGLPSFWTLRAGAYTLTLGLTGFTASNWSASVGLDVLTPLGRPDDRVVGAIGQWLEQQSRVSGLAEVSHAVSKGQGVTGDVVGQAVAWGCRYGLWMVDPADGRLRLRPLGDVPLDGGRLAYRNAAERTAHDLAARRQAVRIDSEVRRPDGQRELVGQVAVAEDRREYRVELIINEESHVTQAQCSCPQLRRQGLKAGVCAHLIALRIVDAQEQARRNQQGHTAAVASVESRMYSRRDGRGVEQTVQVILQGRRLRIRRAQAGGAPQPQMWEHNSVESAQLAYRAVISQLECQGYISATA